MNECNTISAIYTTIICLIIELYLPTHTNIFFFVYKFHVKYIICIPFYAIVGSEGTN